MFISDLVLGKSTIPVAAEVINMTEARHKELVNNIANIDTPYYKAKDINVKEFKELLSKAVDDRHEAHPWQFSMKTGRDVQARKSYYDFHMNAMRDVHEGHVKTGFLVKKRAADTLMRHDQNNVTPEGEMSRLAENSRLHATFISLAKDGFRQIQSAIRLRV